MTSPPVTVIGQPKTPNNPFATKPKPVCSDCKNDINGMALWWDDTVGWLDGDCYARRDAKVVLATEIENYEQRIEIMTTALQKAFDFFALDVDAFREKYGLSWETKTHHMIADELLDALQRGGE